MKLVTFEYKGETYTGKLLGDDKVVNFNYLLQRPDLNMRQIIDEGKGLLERAEAAFAEVDRKDDFVLSLTSVTIKAPLENPGKVVCVGNNYMDHCREQNVEPPENPLIFSKWPSCIIGPEEEIVLPEESEQVDFEAELAVVFNKKAKNLSKDDVYDHCFGFMILNDISARDVQFFDGQWVRGKSFDTFAPAGPYLVTADEVEDPQNLGIRLTINGETFQNSNTKEMIFDIPHLVSYLSKGFAFESGDVLATGTPHGVGVFRKPPVFLKDGDEVVIEIEGLGKLKNRSVRTTNH